jgi:hypothetical protein
VGTEGGAVGVGARAGIAAVVGTGAVREEEVVEKKKEKKTKTVRMNVP